VHLSADGIEPPDGDLLHPELLDGLEARVARDHLAGAARDDGLLPTESADRCCDVRNGCIVIAWVSGGAEQPGNWNDLDWRGSGRVQAGTLFGLGAAWGCAWTGGSIAEG